MLEMLTRLAGRLASQTRRSEESEQLQQFSTPIALGFVAAEAAALTPADLVLEPSAGTEPLAIFAELAKVRPALNEIADTRAALLSRLFREVAVTRHNAEQIHDRLDPTIRPSVVLMNPPFSTSPHVEGRFAEAAIWHIGSAPARLAEGGRLVAITGHIVGPDQPEWRESFIRLQEKGRVVFTATIAGKVYVRHGTSMETRLTVIDRVPADDPRVSLLAQNLCRCRRVARPGFSPGAASAAGDRRCPDPSACVSPALSGQRAPENPAAAARPGQASRANTGRRRTRLRNLRMDGRRIGPLFRGPLRRLRIAGDPDPDARPHPTKLVQSAAMAAVASPRPSYRRHLPPRLLSAGILSDAQGESVVCRRTGFRNLPPGPCARVDLTLPNLRKYLPRKALLAFLGQAHCIKRQKNSNTAHQSTWYPQDQSAEALIARRAEPIEPTTDIVEPIKHARCEGDIRTDRHDREHHHKRQHHAGEERNGCLRSRPRIKHEAPEKNAFHRHQDIHRIEHVPVQHHSEHHRWHHLDNQQRDEQQSRNNGLLKNAEERRNGSCPQKAKTRRRHALLQCNAGPGQGDQEGADVVQHELCTWVAMNRWSAR